MELLHAFIIPIVLAVLSGMGLGGGGLFVVYLKLFVGGEQLQMQAINLLFFIFSAGAALTIHLLRRRIYVSAIILAATAGILGSLIGSLVASSIDGGMLRFIFALMLICAGIYSFFGRSPKKSADGGRVRQNTRRPRGKIGYKSQKRGKENGQNKNSDE